MKKLSIIFILFLLSKISYGQFYAEGNMLAVNSDFEIIKPTCNFIVGAKLSIREKAVEVVWKTKNDTVSGYYMIYKSRDFNNLELVEALLDSGANPNSCSNQRIKCRVRGANITVEVFIDMPLHMASSNGNIEIINKLINKIK